MPGAWRVAYRLSRAGGSFSLWSFPCGMVGNAGLEPATSWAQARCATNCANSPCDACGGRSDAAGVPVFPGCRLEQYYKEVLLSAFPKRRWRTGQDSNLLPFAVRRLLIRMSFPVRGVRPGAHPGRYSVVQTPTKDGEGKTPVPWDAAVAHNGSEAYVSRVPARRSCT